MTSSGSTGISVPYLVEPWTADLEQPGHAVDRAFEQRRCDIWNDPYCTNPGPPVAHRRMSRPDAPVPAVRVSLCACRLSRSTTAPAARPWSRRRRSAGHLAAGSFRQFHSPGAPTARRAEMRCVVRYPVLRRATDRLHRDRADSACVVTRQISARTERPI